MDEEKREEENSAARTGENSMGDEHGAIEENVVDSDPRSQRQASWIRDALAQGMDPISVGQLLGVESDVVAEEDDEMLEYYRTMALQEAKEQAIERLGFDPTVRRPPPPPPTIPEQRMELRTPKPSFSFFPEAVASKPPIKCPKQPPVEAFSRKPPPRPPREALLQTAKPMSHVPPKYRAMQCLGCQQTLGVSPWASLAQCADCFAVSPSCPRVG